MSANDSAQQSQPSHGLLTSITQTEIFCSSAPDSLASFFSRSSNSAGFTGRLQEGGGWVYSLPNQNTK